MTQHDQTARQAFEKWCFGEEKPLERRGDKYIHGRTQDYWDAWQAALQVAPPVTEGDTSFMVDVAAEVARSKLKFPTNEHKLTALFEEAGEVANAFLEHKYGMAPAENIRKECVQLAAMAWRCADEGDHSFPYAGTAPQPPADVSEDERADGWSLSPEAQAAWDAAAGNGTTFMPTEAQEIADAVLATRAKSDERVVSVDDAKAALNWFEDMISGTSFHRNIIRALLTHAAGGQNDA